MKFIILLTLLTPLIIIYVFIFIYFIKRRFFLKMLQNQALLVLILVNFLQASCDLPMGIHFHYFGRVKPSAPAYRTWWTFFQYTLSVSNEFLMATISIQRHILIFNSHLLQIRKNVSSFIIFLFYYVFSIQCFSSYPSLWSIHVMVHYGTHMTLQLLSISALCVLIS